MRLWILLVVLLIPLAVSQASAVSGTLSISSITIAPGGQGAADLRSNVPAPGLGAWTVDITYDPAVVSVASCAPAQGGVCNPAFAANKVRITGASASGLIGDTSLGTITLHRLAASAAACGAASPLSLATNVFADATVGNPQNITLTAPTNGTVTCATSVFPGVPDSEHAILVAWVINDLNSNGQREPDEPGVEGWLLDQACGDALARLGSTDADGRLIAMVRRSEPCFLLETPFGWLAEGGNSRRDVTLNPGATVGLVFLVHQAGEQVENFGGNVIMNGLPAPVGTQVDALFGGQYCGVADVYAAPEATRYSLYVLSDHDRGGCATPGGSVSLTVNGIVVHTETFSPFSFPGLDLILGPAPMYFYLSSPEGTTPIPYVGAVRCGEARLTELGVGLLPSNFNIIYVLPDALRSGCGAPGRTVTIKAGGQIILQLPWHEGLTNELPPFTPIPDVILPEGGSGGSESSGVVAVAALLGAASLAMLVVGIGLARRSRP
jgi:hypothetical protein